MERYITDKQIILIRKMETLSNLDKKEDFIGFPGTQMQAFLILRSSLYTFSQYCDEYEKALKIGYQKEIRAAINFGSSGTGLCSSSISFELTIEEAKTLMARKIEKVKTLFFECFPSYKNTLE